MADSVVGRGTIELVADARKLKAGIEDAKKSIRTLGEGQKDISKAASAGIDRYIGKLQTQNATLNKSARETELFRLALRGASNEQLKTADAALRVAENQAKVAQSAQAVRTAFVAFGAIAATSLLAAAVAFDRLVQNAGDFQDMAEKVGDTAENFASLAVAARVGGVGMDTLVQASVRLTKGLTGVDDESKAAGAAVKALGLNLAVFKDQSPTDQIEAVAQALDKFADGSEKTAVAVALFGKSGAELLPFLKELAGSTGRVNILTSEQIRLADEYSDSQKRLGAEIGLHAQAIATEMLPAITEFTRALRDIAKDAEFAAAATAALKAAFNGVVILFQTVAVVGSDVAFVFQAVGRQIGASIAALERLQRLDIRGFAAISGAVTEDAERARKVLDKFQASVMSIGKSVVDQSLAAQNSRELNRSGVATAAARPRLNFSGAVPKEKKEKSPNDTAAQEAKAQLAFDLEQIRKASEATISAFSNQEKMLQALRSAGLADETKYFADKKALIQANAAEQESAFNKEIARLQLEQFTGKNAAKERLDNDRKIADVQAKIAKVRADTSAEIAVLNIQEFASAQKLAEENNKLARSYEDAKVAADEYIASVIRRNKAELEGVGRGNQFRDIQSGRNQIEDKFIAQQASLNRDLRNQLISPDQFAQYLKLAQDTFSREVIAYEDRTEALLKSQGDWVNGAKEALNNYLDDSRNVAAQTENLLTNAFKSAEDALVEFAKTGKLSFKGLIDSIVSDLARMQAKKVVAAAASGLEGVLGDVLGGLFKKGPNYITGGAGGASWVSGFDLPSHANGISYVPKTGLAMIHEGERIVPKDQNMKGGWGGGITIVNNFPQGTDTRTINQAATRTGQEVNRALARFS